MTGTLAEQTVDRPAPAAAPPRPGRAGVLADRLRRRRTLLLITLVALVAEAVPGTPVLLLAPAGLWLLVGAPALLWFSAADAVLSTRLGRLVLAVGGAVLTDMVLALAVNTVLPLERLPLAVASALFVTAFVLVERPRATPRATPAGLRLRPAARRGATPVFVLGGLAVLLAVAGPIRLNNGRGGGVAVAALLAVAVLAVVLLAGRDRHGPAVTGAGLFAVALALLLLTSLRGWAITGHDIQREYGVFELTLAAGRWSAAAFRDPYNACLSITVLPMSITRLTGIPGVAVFKVVFPALFALAPVALYRAVRHGAPPMVAILAAVYLVAFPTFFTDMPFLARQEIAFLLLACAVLVIADGGRPLRHRRVAVAVLLAGIVLAHYSTTYLVLACLFLAWVAGLAWRRRAGAPLFVTWWLVALTALTAVLWTGPVTQTGGQVRSTAEATVAGLLGRDAASGSSDTAYSLFGGERIAPQERVDDYAARTTAETAESRAAGEYLPLDVVDRYPVVAVEVADQPLTPAGALLRSVGIDVGAVNAFVRQSAARLLQVLLLIGLIGAALRRRPVFAATPDRVLLATGALGVLAVLTVLPQLSVDYGVLRAFQQGLFFFAPFIAAASLWIFGWAGRRAPALAGGLAVVLLLDLTGVVPRALGGYPPQLHLANSGQYYDVYYLHPEEQAGMAWVRDRTTGAVQTDRYTWNRMPAALRQRTRDDIFPTLIGTDTAVVLNYAAVRRHETTVFHRGDVVTYRYPVELLDATKNRIYSSEGTEVYR